MLHVIGGQRCVDRGDHLLARQAEIERDVTRPTVEPLDMRIEEQHRALVKPQPLPHAVAQHEACVEDRDLCLVLWNKLPVQPDLEVGVARVGGEVLTSGHGPSCRCEASLRACAPLGKRD